VNDPQAGAIGLRFRNSAYAFIIAHNLGHILMEHPRTDQLTTEQSLRDEAAADDFAVRVLARDAELPIGASLLFEAQADLMPSLGLFKAQGLSEQAWLAEMQTKIGHPLTAERLKSMVLAVRREGQAQPPANQEAWNSMAALLLGIANKLANVDLQRCVAALTAQASVTELSLRRTSPSESFLGKCAMQR
jgi:hypothetical protein